MLGRAKQAMKEKLGKASRTEEPPEFLRLLQHLKETEQNFTQLSKRTKSVFDSVRTPESDPSPCDNFRNLLIRPALKQQKRYNTARLDMDAKNDAVVVAKPEKKEFAEANAREAKAQYETSKRMLRQIIESILKKRAAVYRETVTESISVVGKIAPPWDGYRNSKPLFPPGMMGQKKESQLSPEQLELVHQMQGSYGVDVQDRKWHLKTYPQCFVASELITWMVDQKEADTREEAVQLAEELRQCQVYYHCSERKVFEDAFLFYRFNKAIEPPVSLKQGQDEPFPSPTGPLSGQPEFEPEYDDVKTIDDSDALLTGCLLLLDTYSSKWSQYYCVVKEGIFTWCAASKTGSVLGEIDLNQATLSDSSMHMDHRQAFTLTDDESQIVYHIDPEEEENRDNWILNISLAIPTKLFGVPLEVAAERSDPQQLVPAPLRVATEWLNIHGLREEGLYRIPGSKDEVDKWINLFDKGSEVIIPEQYSGSNLASLIVQYIRRLPGSLMTDQYAAVFQTVADDEEKSETTRLQIMKKLLGRLPSTNYETLKVLCYHLNQVSLYVEENQMDAGKLAMCVYSTSARPLQMLIFNYPFLFDDEY